MKTKNGFWMVSVSALVCFHISLADAARLKDVVDIEGVRDNPLTGYGLVVGLSGTGDKSANFTNKSLRMMLEKMGITPERTLGNYGDSKDIAIKSNPQANNAASVLVTAVLPPFARQGSKIDVTLSSMGDAKSLSGGTLIMTPLKGADGNVYAVAQGPLVLGGVFAEGIDKSKVQKNHPTVARISGGAIIEREVPFELNRENSLQLALRNPDFTTANRVVAAVNDMLGDRVASAEDSGTVRLKIPPTYRKQIVSLVARLENLQVEPDQIARVVVNERTGTVVMGANVRVSTVAISHGNLTIAIKENVWASASPLPGETDAVTPVGTDSAINAKEENRSLLEMQQGVSLGELVQGLNKMGVNPRDLITILQSIKAAGALQAELEVI